MQPIIIDSLAPTPTNSDRDLDDFAQQCEHCGSIMFVLTLANRIKCYECEQFFVMKDD